MHGRRLLVRVVGVAVIVAATIGIGGPASAAEPPGPTPPGLDHFKCYTPDNTVTTPIATVVSVKLQDQFGVLDVKIARKPNRLCNPTDKRHGDQGFPIQNPDAHLVCHPVMLPAGTTVPPHEVFVTNQFGTARLVTGQPTRLCLPAWKSLEPVFPTPPQPPGLDHFLCYTATYSTTVVDRFGNLGAVVLADQFENVDARVGAPRELCNPVQKTLPTGQITPITNREAHLICHVITQPPHNPRVVFFKHQLGTARYGTLKPTLLCTPSFKNEIPPPG